MVLHVALGVIAGVLTTIAGLGGGLVLLLALSLVLGPLTALAVTAPALLIGNLHRLWLYRGAYDRAFAHRFAAGAIPGGIAGGFAAASLPTWILHSLMLAMTALAVARAAGILAWRPPPAVLIPAGAVVGVITATSGGAAVMTTPLVMATGISGDLYIGTLAFAAVSLHVGRIIAYGASGLFVPEVLQLAAVLALAISVGNVLGARARAKMSPRALKWAELGVLVISVGLALVGIG